MALAFVKMHALGNDFIIIDRIKDNTIALPLAKRQWLADRHLGIGCDQLLVIDRAVSGSNHFCYQIFNADGSEVEQCGNGARCVARYLIDKHNIAADAFALDCQAGTMHVKACDNQDIAVNMGVASFAPQSIGLGCQMQQTCYSLDINGEMIEYGAVSMGNPHAVITVDKIDFAKLDAIGQWLNTMSDTPFTKGVNVGFMCIINPEHIHLTVYERGVGRTLACGSGACAAVVIGQQWGKLAADVMVTLPGGQLRVSCRDSQSPVWLQGPAEYVFQGQTLD